MVKLQKKWKSPPWANCTWLVRVLVKLAENLVPPPQEVKSPHRKEASSKYTNFAEHQENSDTSNHFFLPLQKKIKTFIDQSWSQNLMYQKFLQIHNPYPISSCGPSFQCHLKLFRRAFLSSRSSPGLTIQPKRSSTRGESLFGPIRIKEYVFWSRLACHLRWIRSLCLFTRLAGKAKPKPMAGQTQSTVLQKGWNQQT